MPLDHPSHDLLSQLCVFFNDLAQVLSFQVLDCQVEGHRHVVLHYFEPAIDFCEFVAVSQLVVVAIELGLHLLPSHAGGHPMDHNREIRCRLVLLQNPQLLFLLPVLDDHQHDAPDNHCGQPQPALDQQVLCIGVGVVELLGTHAHLQDDVVGYLQMGLVFFGQVGGSHNIGDEGIQGVDDQIDEKKEGQVGDGGEVDGIRNPHVADSPHIGAQADLVLLQDEAAAVTVDEGIVLSSYKYSLHFQILLKLQPTPSPPLSPLFPSCSNLCGCPPCPSTGTPGSSPACIAIPPHRWLR